MTTIEDLPAALDYIRLLELNIKRISKELREANEDNQTLARKCKEHFNNAQNLMRYELKIEQKERVTTGVVAGTGEEFTLK
mgnify:CR=1 FL=1